MNILTEALPEAIEIDGQEYPINSDFRTCLRIIMAFEDEELTGYEKQLVMLQLLYKNIPENIQVATTQGVKFLDGGEVKVEEEGLEPQPRLYSFSKDSGFIFSAFMQTHGIDLTSTENLHWWKFLALFLDLGQDTTFCNLTSLRKKIKTGTATKEERQAARDMGEIFDIPEPDTRTLDEKMREEEFMRAVEGASQYKEGK